MQSIRQYHKTQTKDWKNFNLTALEQLWNLRINKLQRTNIERISLRISSSTDRLFVTMWSKYLKCETNRKSLLPTVKEGKTVLNNFPYRFCFRSDAFSLTELCTAVGSREPKDNNFVLSGIRSVSMFRSDGPTVSCTIRTSSEVVDYCKCDKSFSRVS